MDRRRGRVDLRASLKVACVLAGSAAASNALALPSILNTNGFEGYSLSSPNLEGQQQTVAQGSNRQWLHAGDGGSSAFLQSSVVESGSKAIQVNKGSLSDDRWAVRVGDLGFPSYRYVTIDWDMFVVGTGASGSVLGPFFGVDTYDDTDVEISPQVLGSLGVDASTGDVLYQLENTGFLEVAGSKLSFSQWHHFQIRLDFAQDEYQIFVNGSQLASTGFVDGPSSNFTDADIATFAAQLSAPSHNQTGSAYFDNFLVKEYVAGDFDVDGNVDGSDLSLWQSSYGLNAVGDADFDGDTDGADYLIWQQNLTVGSSNVAGDFDHDGDVDGDDLSLWQSAHGQTAVGDADLDGDSDGADFLIWQRNLGTGIPAETIAAAIPEPSSVLLLTLLGLAAFSTRR